MALRIKGYRAEAKVMQYRRKDGTLVRRKKRSWKVKGHHRKDTGRKGRTPVKKQWFKTTEKLTGYSPFLPQAERRKALENFAKKKGDDSEAWLDVFHKVHALSNLVQNTQPENSKRYKSDAMWIDGIREERFGSR